MDLFTLVGKIAIDCTEAETKINSLLEKAGQLNTALGGTGSTGGASGSGSTSTNATSPTTISSTSTTGSSGLFGGAMSVIIGNLSSMAIHSLVEAIKSGVKDGYEYNLDKESYVATIKTMTNSSWEEAEAYFDELNKLAIESPLDMGSVGYAATRFLASGMDEEKTSDMIRTLADVSTGDNDKFTSLVKALSDVMNKGVLQAQERNQFADAGVGLYPLLAKYYGYTGTNEENTARLMALQEEGMITAADVLQALVLSTQEGGQYYKATEIAMGTTKGKSQKADELSDKYFGTVLEESGMMNLIDTGLDFLNKFLEYETNRLEEDGLFGWKEIPENLKRLYHELGFGVGSSSPTEEEYAEEMRQRYEDRYGTPPPADWDWNVGSSTENSADTFANTIATKVAEAVANEMPAAIASGMSNVTITTGNVTLNDGVLVGRLLPRINTGLGQLALRDLRG